MLGGINICNLVDFSNVMKQRLTFHYTNPGLHIGLNSWREVYLLLPEPMQLYPEVYRGELVYRAKGSSRRITYIEIKKGLLKRKTTIEQEVPDWL
jgi:hypothetical protein